MKLLSEEEFEKHMEQLKERAGLSRSETSDLAIQLNQVSDALQRFNAAIGCATEEWPEVVLEDILDAEYISED